MEAGSTLKFSWKIKNFSSIQAKILSSDVFSLGSHKWRIFAYPKGDDEDNHLSVYLEVAGSETLPSGWSRNVKFSLTVIDQINNKSYTGWTYEEVHKFDAGSKNWGWPSFIPLKELRDPKNGFLVRDSCIIEAEVTIYEDVSVESRGAMNGTSKKEPTKADMDAFFGDLNSVIFPMKVVSSEDEAKQALEVIDEALNMAPVDLNNQGRMLQLTNKLDVLASLDGGWVLTSKQKAELLSMKDNIIDLPERAANAFEDRKLFSEKELVKKTLDQKLGKCLVEFEKAKVEAEQTEDNIATLQERVDSLLAQIGEKKKKKENSLSKQKEMFKLSKELKEELDLLVESWPVYEAKKKAAEDEEKVVGREWSKMKKLVSSLKKSFYSSLKPQSTPAKRKTRKR